MNSIIFIIFIISIKNAITNVFIVDINLKKLIIKPLIISLMSKFIFKINYIFCNYYYIIMIINRTFIFIIIKLKKIIIKISIRDLKSKIYYFNKYVILIFYIIFF